LVALLQRSTADLQYGSTQVGHPGTNLLLVANSDSEAECSSLEARHDKSHQIYSKAMDIDRSTCWENEMDGVEYGARRRSIWIDPPVVANEAATDKTKGCLRLWFSGECGSGNPSATMTFTQSREWDSVLLWLFRPIGYTLMHARRISSMLYLRPRRGRPGRAIRLCWLRDK
jgi:hypothetical protein